MLPFSGTPTKNRQLLETYDATKYGSGWRNNVINQCLEFVLGVLLKYQWLPRPCSIKRMRQAEFDIHTDGVERIIICFPDRSSSHIPS